MRLTYDPEANAARLRLQDERRDEVAETFMCDYEIENAAVILELDREGRLLGVEIRGVTAFFRQKFCRRRSDPNN